jgi:lauroyl/myristoyl acyltransferase
MNLGEQIKKGTLGLLESIAGGIGPNNSRHMGRGVARVTSSMLNREFRIQEAQLEFLQRSIPSLRGVSPTEFNREVFYHVGESLAELFTLKQHLKDTTPSDRLFPGIFCVDSESGAEVFKQAKLDCSAGISNLTISGHIGNFELLGAYHASSGIPTTIVGRQSKSPAVDDWLQSLRTKHGGQSLVREENSSNRKLSVKLIGALKTGQSLGAFLDQDTTIESDFAPFFGLEASYLTGPVRLAVRYRVKIFTTFIVRVQPMKHRIVSQELHYNPDSPTATSDILKEYSSRLEALLIDYPFQYPWFHRRWRRRPNIDYSRGKVSPRSTDDYIAWIRTQHPLQDTQII